MDAEVCYLTMPDDNEIKDLKNKLTENLSKQFSNQHNHVRGLISTFLGLGRVMKNGLKSEVNEMKQVTFVENNNYIPVIPELICEWYGKSDGKVEDEIMNYINLHNISGLEAMKLLNAGLKNVPLMMDEASKMSDCDAEKLFERLIYRWLDNKLESEQ